jgi:hypothetical protein
MKIKKSFHSHIAFFFLFCKLFLFPGLERETSDHVRPHFHHILVLKTERIGGVLCGKKRKKKS